MYVLPVADFRGDVQVTDRQFADFSLLEHRFLANDRNAFGEKASDGPVRDLRTTHTLH